MDPGKGERTLVSVNGDGQPEQAGPRPDEQRPAGKQPTGYEPTGYEPTGDEPGGPQPSRGDKRLYFVLMTLCIGLFVLAWAVVDRYSVIAAVVISAVALVIPPFAAIVANVASASRRRDQ